MDTTEPKLELETKEAFHLEAESRVATFAYSKPPATERPKDISFLTKSPLMRVNVQVVREGGENNLHYHTGSDTTWLVIKGRCKFYGLNDVLIGDLGPLEGILLPGGARYWFEKTGDEDLEILQIVAYDRAVAEAPQRVNLEQHKSWMTNDNLRVYENPEPSRG